MSATAGADSSFKVAAQSKSGKWFCYDSANSQKGVYASAQTSGAITTTTC